VSRADTLYIALCLSRADTLYIALCLSRADTLYIALCLSRAVGVLVRGLFAGDRRWCLNEKGALAVAETLPGAPRAFGPRALAKSAIRCVGEQHDIGGV
jgi:hypothetical protein